jgi:hypothetical protein
MEWNIQDGLPPKLKRVDLAFLDPPYWKQAPGQYSDDARDLGNIADIETFNGAMLGIFSAISALAVPRIAVVIQPTQYNNGMVWRDHIFDFARMLDGYRIEMRYALPYSTQQYNAQQVEKAKAERVCLNLIRDLVIWKRI